jgi:hypothetical protein
MAGKGKYKKATKKAKSSTLSEAQKKEVKKINKKMMNKVIETKNVDYLAEGFILYHNIPTLVESDCFYLSQGVQDSSAAGPPNRIGDSVYAKSVWMKWFIDQYQDRPNITLRFTVLRIKTGAIPLTSAQVYQHPQGGNSIINPINTEHASLYTKNPVVYDKRVVINTGITLANSGGKDSHYYKEKTFKVNKSLKYDSGAQNVSGPFTIQVFVTAYDSYGTLTSDAIARLMWARRSYFMDA